MSSDSQEEMSSAEKHVTASYESQNPRQRGFVLASRFEKLDLSNIQRVDFEETEKTFKYQGKHIGGGAYGEAYEGKFNENTIAVTKFVEYNRLDQKNYIMYEILKLHEFNNENIIGIYAYAHSEINESFGKFALILEHGGSTLEYLVKHKKLNSKDAISILSQISKGLEYMHNFKKDESGWFAFLKNFTWPKFFLDSKKELLIHRDLKPKNIFLKKDKNGSFIVKIGDLGIIRNTGQEGTVTNNFVLGTRFYMAPEVFKQHLDEINSPNRLEPNALIYTQSIDIFALGLIADYIITGIRPYSIGITQASGKVPCLPNSFPPRLRAYILKMTAIKVKSRPTAGACTTFFQEFQNIESMMQDFNKAYTDCLEAAPRDYEYIGLFGRVRKRDNSQCESHIPMLG